MLSTQTPQGFAGFPWVETRTRASRSQSKRATNCATPGYGIVVSVVFHVVLAVFWPSALRKWFPLLVVSQRVEGLGFFLHGWAGYAPKASALHLQSNPEFFSQRKHILNFLSQSAKEGAAADTADPSYFTGFPSKVKRILFCKALFLQSPLQKQTRKCTLPGDNSTNNLPNRKPWHRKAQKPLRK